MRNAFAEVMTELVEDRDDLVLLAGDIGNRLFDKFKKKAPQNFFNCGVAEAGMTGIASGLASVGFNPFTYTITPFNTLRCLEQIRLDICYPNLPVTIVGTGSGLSYAGLGATHHSLEDIACMRMLPNMNVICPGDSVEVKLAVEAALNSKEPCYIRLGKKGEETIHLSEKPNFSIGKGITITNGSDIAILGIGNMLGPASAVKNLCNENNISTKLISFHTIKPLDKKLLDELFENYSLIVVVEEHGLVGGGGSAILEYAFQAKKDITKLMLFNTPDKFLTSVGTQTEARLELGLDPDSIFSKIKQNLK